MSDEHTAETLFERGLPVRREVLGAEYVDTGLANANDFMMAFQRATTEMAWGYAWARPGLDRKTRSMLNLAMLTALRAHNELKLHTKGALANGVTVEEIKETLLHAAVYCGIPAALEAFKAANEVLVAEGVVPATGRGGASGVGAKAKVGAKGGAKVGAKAGAKAGAKVGAKPPKAVPAAAAVSAGGTAGGTPGGRAGARGGAAKGRG